MFSISDVVGTSRPSKAAALLRAISIRFIQPGRRAKIAKPLAQCAMAGHVAFDNAHNPLRATGLLPICRKVLHQSHQPRSMLDHCAKPRKFEAALSRVLTPRD